MYSKLNIETWNRKEHFHFFCKFDEPYFGLTSLVDVTKAYAQAKERKISFFIYYLHKSLIAINRLQAMKYRIFGNEVHLYDKIHASATINRDDGTFGFSFIIYDEDFSVFEKNAHAEIERIRKSTNLFPERNGQDAVHYSSIPWVRFTSLSHARHFAAPDSAPKISFGKTETNFGQITMPCSIHVHHALADGKDVGDYFDLFQTLLDI
ncbi:MAG: chloramphenicol acetyltransferase [Saprospiraceae bacterium]|nr:chloramphenicol acetyltransferase [Saprospiraceae bacterium]